MPALQSRGCEIAFWHEEAVTPSRPRVAIPPGAPVWSVAGLGEERAINVLKDWRPDVIYAHGLRSPAVERRTQRIAPAVFFAHAYYGACISGAKTFRWPGVEVCDRQFGWQCFLHYYPRRCGGLNPLTMLREHKRQADRLELLSDYQSIAVASEHMANEYRKHGLADHVRVVSLPICLTEETGPANREQSPERGWQLLFIGRMEFLKGGEVLLEALPLAQRELGRTLNVTFAGDGPLRPKWQRRAGQLAESNSGLKFNFTGWITAEERNSLLRDCDLLVVPSVWPEPFGLIGPEAGQYGVPSVAFAVGGITAWLRDGVNGFLAAPDQPKEKNLAKAIVRCLQDAALYKRLRQGAWEQAHRFSTQAHLADLLPLLETAASDGAGDW